MRMKTPEECCSDPHGGPQLVNNYRPPLPLGSRVLRECGAMWDSGGSSTTPPPATDNYMIPLTASAAIDDNCTHAKAAHPVLHGRFRRCRANVACIRPFFFYNNYPFFVCFKGKTFIFIYLSLYIEINSFVCSIRVWKKDKQSISYMMMHRMWCIS